MRLFHLLVFTFCLQLTLQANSIVEAQRDKLISFSIKGNDEGTHYHTPLIITIVNSSSKTLNLDLSNGTILEASDTSFQNFIVTEDLIVNLKPKETISRPIHAMCIESSDAAPGGEQNYQITSLAGPELVKFSAYVESHKLFEPNAQFLMWDLVSGSYKDNQIDDFEIDEDGNIWILDKVEEAVTRLNFVEEEVVAVPKPQLIVSGEFTMNLASAKNVHIAMFNINNVLVKELYNNPKTPSGKTSLAYSFNSYDFEDEEYYIKLVVDGRVLSNRRVEMSY